MHYSFRIRFFTGFIVLFSLLTLLIGPVAHAQEDSTDTRILKEYAEKLRKIDSLRQKDSLEKAALELKLINLQSKDNQEKLIVLREIERLKSRDSITLAIKKARIDSLRKTVTGSPVLGFFNDTLLMIYSRTGGVSRTERAENIGKRLSRIAGNLLISPDSLKIVELDNSTEIVAGELIVMNITETDALWNGKRHDSLAGEYLSIFKSEIREYREQTSASTLWKEAGTALLVILAILILIYIIKNVFRWTAKKITGQHSKLLKGVKVGSYSALDENTQVKILLRVNTFVKWVVILLVIYLGLPVLFGIFPWTEDLAEKLFGYVWNPIRNFATSIWNYLPNLGTILVVIIVFRYILKGLKFIKNEIESGNLKVSGFYPDWANPSFQILRILVFAFMLIIIFPYLPGSDSPVFKGVSVFLGFLFTFGSAGSLSNMIAGLVLTYMRMFNIGDRVKIGEQTGDVVEKSLLVTRIRTVKNEIISIPNSMVMSNHTINYSIEAAGRGLIIHTTVTIGYNVPWRDMHQALLDAAGRTENVLKEPLPFVLQTALSDFYVSYQINAFIRNANGQSSVYSELHQHIQDVCNERHIEIMSPHYIAERDGNHTSIPDAYLGKDYQAPGFNIRAEEDKIKKVENNNSPADK